MDRLVSVTIVIADEDDFAGMNEEYITWFPTDPPARQGAKMPARIAGLKISIAVIAEGWISRLTQASAGVKHGI